MSEPTPRQVLYALVAGGFFVVVLILVIGAALSGLVPMWWTIVAAVALAGASVWSALNWKRTAPVLILAMAFFLIWALVTLIVAG
ncbi:MAG: hypothetical protein WAN34_03760 [Acidimicrobiia bacterium]